ncbi:hypothetical protein LIPSTDRAFT_278062 [Lipomyces starkeyi NRRL Y-11557]|uniref:Uncharacterized protein n=1 Tax=Lipomyces starkeyi NRRL Y-11557 TaxID=675824 RepID=A0A1E3Q595_LIPST|nr:hypothetical protein LIPSTDRAFT_278062 [Lipomyces starkeyi NRRL Y-11557]
MWSSNLVSSKIGSAFSSTLNCSSNGNASPIIRPISRLSACIVRHRPRPLPTKLISISNAISMDILLSLTYCSLLISLAFTSVLNTSINAISSVPIQLWPLKLYGPIGPLRLACHIAFSNKARSVAESELLLSRAGNRNLGLSLSHKRIPI